jgi:hypothetical protein
MDEPSFEQLERLIASCGPAGAPPELRWTVVAQMRRELAAARWDRRMGRLAAALLVAGVGLNAAIGFSAANSERPPLAAGSSPDSFVQAGVTVAQATDAETGRLVARQLAAWDGRRLTTEQLATLDAAIAAAPL